MKLGKPVAKLRLLTVDGRVIDPTLFCHIETVTIAGATYYLLKTTPADTTGATFSCSTASTGKYLLTYNTIGSRFVFRLTGIAKILSATINAVYRAYTGGGTVNGVIDILIRKADGTVRTTIATSVSASANWGSTWATYTGANYSFSEYVVVDETDYLEIDFYANITAKKAGQYCYLRVDDNTLSEANQTRSTGWTFTYTPTVVTLDATNITVNSAQLNGEVTAINDTVILERGFEWGFQSGVYQYSWTETGNFGIGRFSYVITNLPLKTKVYFRAKARSINGWGYGLEKCFGTPLGTQPLKFSNKYVVTSTNPVRTSSSTLVDDTEAIINFSLTESKVVLVIYQANTAYTAYQSLYGMQNAINIDGVDYAYSFDSSSELIARNMTFWVGVLGAGNHTVKGRFANNYSGETVTIWNRVLLVIVFDGDTFDYIDNATATSISSSSLRDEPYSVMMFTPLESCKALIMYNISSSYGGYGKRVVININGTDYAQAEKSPTARTNADSVFTAYALSLSTTPTIVKGRVASIVEGEAITICRRQLAVLLFDDSTLLDVVNVVASVSTTSNTLVDDQYATITRTTTDTRELLTIAVGTKRHNTSSSLYGECYGIRINNNDRAHSRGAIFYSASYYPNSAATAYAEQLPAGNHIIKGRFSNNYGTETAVISARILIALWFSIAPLVVETKITNDYPMYYLPKPLKAQKLLSKVEGATITTVAKNFPETLIKKGKAQELRSKFT